MAPDLNKLQQQLAYQFSDPTLLRLALTHGSAQKPDNQRLEFLGDALLDLVVAELLYNDFPELDEGELSRRRANVVNKKALAKIARKLELSSYLIMGAGERKSGGQRRASNLADSVEAVIAAVYLDGGMDACSALVKRLVDPLLHSGSDKDAKTLLQEYMQSRAQALPEYRVVAVEGEEHAKTYLVECSVAGLAQPQQGSGSSKRLAEQEAAGRILELLPERLGDGP